MLSLALAHALCFDATAQHQNPITKNYNGAHGLSHNTVRCITQDRYGFLWIGTDDGLNHFDGYTFKVYNYNPHDTNSLPHTTINNLCLDAHDNLWIATPNGLAKFSLVTETFTRYLQGVQVGSVIADSTGGLWIGTLSGLHYFNPDEQKWQRWTTENSDLISNTIRRLYLDSRGLIWILPAYKAAQIFNPRTQTFYTFSNLATGFTGTLHAIYEDAHKAFWILTHEKILWRYRPTLHSADTLQAISSVPLLTKLREASDMCGTEDREGRLWLAMNSVGIFIFNPQNAELLHVIDNEQTELLGSSLYILSIFRDKTGIIWIGTDIGGLYKWDWRSELFNFYGHSRISRNTLSHPMVRGIYADRNGTVWVCTQGGGLNKLERQGGRQKWMHYTVASHGAKGLTTDVLWAIHAAPSGEFWLGGNNALIKFNPKNETFYTETITSTVTVIYPDGPEQQANLWIGTEDGLLFREAKTGKLKVLENPYDSSRKFRYIEALHKEGKTLWVGCVSGLYRVNILSGKIERHYMFSTTTDLRISGNYVTHIYRDLRGILWICTKGGGLKILKDTATGAFESITTENGLPHNYVYAVLEDDTGQLWMSTDKGIAKYNPDTKKFRIFTIADGLQSNEFNRRAYFKSKSGEFFFGGINGFNSFFPEKLSLPATLSRPILTRFKKYNEPVGLDTAIFQRNRLELSHLDDFFSFEFAASDFHTPEQKRYRYKLVGYDKDWIETNAAQRKAVYRNLPAGEYEFCIQVANPGDSWSSESTTLSVIMRPAPWRTWWAYSLYVLFGAGAVMFFVWQRTQRLKKENLRLEALVQARTQEFVKQNQLLEVQAKELRKLNELRLQFFSMATHDLKNPLQVISGFTRLIDEEKKLENVKTYAVYISSAAERMLRLIEELLQSMELDLGITLSCMPVDICMLIKSVIEGNQANASNKSQRIIFESNPTPLYTNVDESRMRHALDNLLSNAIKYSPHNTTITISCKKIIPTQNGNYQNGNYHKLNINRALPLPYILVAIKDQGLGLTAEDLGKLFGRFQRLSARPTGGESSTGLGLSIVKEIAEMHGGKVWAESEGKNMGSTFFIALPAIVEQKTLRQGSEKS
ncbi:MAG: two-component regulator propeller domain-containing protein [Candidatus Thermochlorobacter sp.]